MKAAIINKTGGPEVIELKDLSLEKPAKDEVTIELEKMREQLLNLE